MCRLLCIFTIVFASASLDSAPLFEKWQKRINDAETTYAAAVKKADNVRFFSLQKANGDRINVLKKGLSDATKAGEFDAATAFKERLVTAEKNQSTRRKPKNVVNFGNHEFALIEDKASWYLAKLRCEEMGGHLAVIDTPQKQEFVLKLCAGASDSVWLGALNEDGNWVWVTGLPVTSTVGWTINEGPSHSVGLSYWHASASLDDFTMGGRLAYICEWD
ncbi:MAG: hypothetical protein JWM11_1927 [Planctomycetaceae bacterium]|nr:hypothetical protein [Planctomycetaceae bacterium]